MDLDGPVGFSRVGSSLATYEHLLTQPDLTRTVSDTSGPGSTRTAKILRTF